MWAGEPTRGRVEWRRTRQRAPDGRRGPPLLAATAAVVHLTALFFGRLALAHSLTLSKVQHTLRI
jgi:hypothetical protein